MHDGPFDAISSIGMFEHVGAARLDEYFSALHRLVRPGGRVLNHGIARPASSSARPRFARRGFIDRYVFPDGELHEVGSVVSRMQHARVSRPGMSRDCASTTRSRCGRGCGTSKRRGRKPSRRSAPVAHACGACTWRRPR